MLFNSLSFAVFMTAVFLIYWNIPAGYRYLVVLAANCYFYLGFGVRNFILLCIVCVATYLGAIFMEKCHGSLKKLCFGLPFAVSLGLLLVFKYFNFAGQVLSDTLGIFGIGFTPAVLKLAAPIGISFYTFKVISYMIEVYRGKLPAQRNFANMLCMWASFHRLHRDRLRDRGISLRGLSTKLYRRVMKCHKKIAWKN